MIMTSLEQKQKRVQFLKYLESRGIETVSKQLERNENEIKFILEQKELRNDRDKKLNHLLNGKLYR